MGGSQNHNINLRRRKWYCPEVYKIFVVSFATIIGWYNAYMMLCLLDVVFIKYIFMYNLWFRLRLHILILIRCCWGPCSAAFTILRFGSNRCTFRSKSKLVASFSQYKVGMNVCKFYYVSKIQMLEIMIETKCEIIYL